MPRFLYRTLFAGKIKKRLILLRMKKIIDFIVQENKKLNDDTFLLVLYSPELPEIKAGQFVNVKVEDSPSTFLRRPISVHDVEREKGLLYLMVKIAGKGTARLATLKEGDNLNIVLPLGNSFTIPSGRDRCLLVGGGVGGVLLEVAGNGEDGVAHADFSHAVRAAGGGLAGGVGHRRLLSNFCCGHSEGCF